MIKIQIILGEDQNLWKKYIAGNGSRKGKKNGTIYNKMGGI